MATMNVAMKVVYVLYWVLFVGLVIGYERTIAKLKNEISELRKGRSEAGSEGYSEGRERALQRDKKCDKNAIL